MSSTFHGLNIAKTGLFASQKALELAGNNVSNVSTEGYTRQRLHLTSLPPASIDGLINYSTKATVGNGVEVDYIQQVRDEFLDSQYRGENSGLGYWTVKSDALYYLEDVFNEPSDTGISSVLSTFYDSLQQLSKTPENKDTRTLVTQNAISVCETINGYAKTLLSLQGDQNNGAEITAKQINEYAKQISELNKEIAKYELNGDRANELNDKRNMVLDKLSGLVDISYKYNSDNKVAVYIGKDTTNADMCLVDSESQLDQAADGPIITDKNIADAYGNANKYSSFTLKSSANGNVTNLTADKLESGELKSYMDMRDGNTKSNMGIPYIIEQVDTVARGITRAYNEVNKKGYGIPNVENGNVSKTGLNFFEVPVDASSVEDYSLVNAYNMSISEAIKESVYNIGASAVKVDLDAENTNIGNNQNALELVKVATNGDVSGIGNIDSYLTGFVSEVGVEASHSNETLDNQETIVDSIDYKRQSVSGVSVDEEIINVITYQKTYAAASRVISAIDSMLDILINNTGVVGR